MDPSNNPRNIIRRCVSFLQELVHPSHTQQPQPQQAQQQQAEVARRSNRGGLSAPRTTLAATRPARLAPLPQASSAANIVSPTPGLQAFLDGPHGESAMKTGYAVDFGCGRGRDTRALIERHWKVHAVDRDPYTDDALQDAVQGGAATVHVGTLHDADIPLGSADIVNAQRVFPFLGNDLSHTLGRARNLLRPGGFLVASFFGPQHSWMGNQRLTFHDVARVRDVLEAAGFKVTQIDDVHEWNHLAANGERVRDWHEIRVQAQRQPDA